MHIHLDRLIFHLAAWLRFIIYLVSGSFCLFVWFDRQYVCFVFLVCLVVRLFPLFVYLFVYSFGFVMVRLGEKTCRAITMQSAVWTIYNSD